MNYKSLFNFCILLLCLLVGGVSNAWCADEQSLTLNQTNLELTGSYTTNTEKTVEGITFVYTNLMKSGDNIQAKASTGVIYNKTPFPTNIVSVQITHSGTGYLTTILGSSDGENWTEVSSGNGSITGDFSNKGYKFFKITRGANAAYWTQIVVNYEKTAAPGVTEAPSISGNTSFLDNTTVTISNAASADGAAIYYTLNGDDPTATTSETCFEYTEPFEISSTATVKAIAKKGDDAVSSVVSKTFTKVVPLTVAEAIAETPASGTSDDVYIHGIVSAFFKTSIVGDGNNYRYYISDDGTTANQLLVFRGKGLNNVAFSDADDLQLGDEVIIYGGLTTFNEAPEVAANNYLVSLSRKASSDLTITSTTAVELEITSAELNPTSTITWTTSSTGTISFSSSDDNVATVSEAGVITAIGEGSATITISQDADETYKASNNKTVDITVTDNRSACVTDIDLSSPKTLTKGDIDDFAVVSTKAAGFTGTIVYSYESSNASILDIAGDTYSAEGVGEVTVTITATPTGSNAVNYKSTSQEVVVVVNGENSIVLDKSSETVLTSDAPFVINATVPTDNYNGTISAVSSNTAVATVSVEGTIITVTPVAAGAATVTVTAGTDTYYPTIVSEECSVTVTAPEGKTTAPSGIVTTTFKNKDLEYDGEGMDWNASIDATFESAGNSRGVQFGAGKGEFTLSAANSGQVTKVSMVVSTNEAGNTISVKVGEEDFETTYGDVDPTTTLTLTKGMINETVEFTGTGSGDIVISVNDKSKSVWFKSISVAKELSKTVTINQYGYATYCSEYPIDFSAAEGYTAWRVSQISSEGVVTFEKITDIIKGGQGVLLYNKDADGENPTDVTIRFADGTKEFSASENLFFGTTAATYIADDEYFGLSGDKFVKVNAGTIPAGKALLPVSEIPANARQLTFVFDEGGQTTGVETVSSKTAERKHTYNLNGQRVDNPAKGLYIVEGRKVVVR